jgi:hypothetical protein
VEKAERLTKTGKQEERQQKLSLGKVDRKESLALEKPHKNERLEKIRQGCIQAAEIARQREAVEVLQLPLWQDEKRGTPNSFLRSALFAAIQSKDRVFVKEAVLASQEGILVRFTGEQLNQEDLTVWETLVHIAREHPLGNECVFTGYSVLKFMALPQSVNHYKTLQASVARLTACLVQIESEQYAYGGSLVESFAIDKKNKRCRVRLNRDLIKLFREDDWTGIEWQKRLQLRRKPLAQALHAYYSSHRDPYPVKLATLQSLTGSKNAQAAGFKVKVKAALDVLVEIGFLANYTIERNIVKVKRALSERRK